MFPSGPFYVKGCSLHGFVMFAATADEHARLPGHQPLGGDGEAHARIDRVMPLLPKRPKPTAFRRRARSTNPAQSRASSC